MTEGNKKLLKGYIVDKSTKNTHKNPELEARLKKHTMSDEELVKASEVMAKRHKPQNCNPNADGIVYCT